MTSNGDALQRLREQIDLLDGELLQLLSRRAKIVYEVALVKQTSGLPVYDSQREQQILDRICHLNQGPLAPQGLINIFRRIIHESRKIEESSMRQTREDSFQQENFNGDQHGSRRIRS